MERKPQSYSNHAKFDPAFHFFLAPISLITLVYAIRRAIHDPTVESIWIAGLAFLFPVVLVRMRTYCLKVQDRVIRLEERLRMAEVLPQALRSRIPELTEGQLISLRFASDAELPALVQKALGGGISNKEIKQEIRNWRPDYFRV